MEGQVLPASDRNNATLMINLTSRDTQASTEAERSSETYVVQIPRDQVYRIPPPENARIVEIYSKPDQKNNKCACTCCCWIFSTLIFVGIVLGIVFGVMHATYKPKSPEFHLTHIQAKNLQQSPNGSNKLSRPKFEISIMAENPGERFDVSYKEAGKASLVFNKNIIAQGEFPRISQLPKQPTKIALTLDGIKATLSNEKRKSLIDDSSPKMMKLKIDVSMEMKSWIKSLTKDITITCDFKVNSFRKKTKISTEDCVTNF